MISVTRGLRRSEFAAVVAFAAFAVLALISRPGFCAGEEGFFRVESLVIGGKDATAQKGCLDLEAANGDASSTSIELPFVLSPANNVEVAKFRLICHAVSSTGWTFQPQYLEWNAECRYDAATGRGVFRVARFPIAFHSRYAFSVDVSRVAPGAPAKSPYEFLILTYPSAPRVDMGAMPFYVLPDQYKNAMLTWPTDVYDEMNRFVPPNSSLFFSFNPAKEFWPAAERIAPWLKIYLVRLDARNDEEAFRPLRTQSDVPRGAEIVLHDGPAGKTRPGFTVQITDLADNPNFLAPKQDYRGEQQVWIRNPAPGRPEYENADYLEPGAYYSLQFEIDYGPYKGIRYEASRFGVRPRFEKRLVKAGLDVAADYAAPNFVDWRGDWLNGHLYPTNNVPGIGWNPDFLLMKDARDKYPDLWRTFHFQYVADDFSAMFNILLNLFRDRSIRAVSEARRDEAGDVVVGLKHIIGAEFFHDPDVTSDTLAQHPVVADASEKIYAPGDLVFLQAKDRLLEAKVKSVRPAQNQVVLEAQGDLWPVWPEGRASNYPAVLGALGSETTTITLAGSYTGTYLRQRNGRPYVNWAIANWTFDFVVDTMNMRASIELYNPSLFVGDALTGRPSRGGWQILSDCRYYFVRHLLKRYPGKPLDTFIHPIFGEGTGWQQGGNRYVQLYDYHADGILRAYEDVLGVRGEDYKKIRIGLGGIMLAWNLEPIIRFTLAHALPAPLEKIFPADAPKKGPAKAIPNMPLESNPLYYFTNERSVFTPADRELFYSSRWNYNACFLDESGNPVVRPGDWDEQGRLTSAAISRLLPTWRNSRWLLENTRFGKGTPFRGVNVEGYGYSAEDLAKCILFEKELLAQLDTNLRAASNDPYVRDYLQGVYCGTIQDALFDWSVSGAVPAGKPFQGTGYWPSYFADVMRRVVGRAAAEPPGIFNVGTLTFDTFLGPDGANGGTVSDTASFITKVTPWGAPRPTRMVDIGNGKKVEVDTGYVTFEKDIRKFIRFVGMMTHRLAALPEQRTNGHVVSGVMSKEWTNPPAGAISGNGPGESKKFYVLLYDHYAPDLESQDTTRIPVRLAVRNLPAGIATARVTVYRVDKEHGSLYPVTERKAFREHFREATTFNQVATRPEDVAALRQTVPLPMDESFARNGERFDIAGERLDLNLALAANRTLFVVIDGNDDSFRPKAIRVAAVQFAGVPGTVDENLNKAERLIRKAAARGAKYILLPEVYALFPKARDHRPVEEVRAEAQTIPGPMTNRLVALCRELNVNVAAGMSERRGEKIYNSVVFLTPQGPVGSYSKRVLITTEAVMHSTAKMTGRPVPTPSPEEKDKPRPPDERTTYSPGAQAVVVDWGGVRTGALICADGGFANMWQETLAKSPELICWPISSFGWVEPKGPSVGDMALKYHLPIVYANRTRELPICGYSRIADAKGNELAEVDTEPDAILIGDVTIGETPPPAGN